MKYEAMTSINDLPFWIYATYIKYGIEHEVHIKTRDMKGVQDAMIGDFAENWYIRPSKATRSIPYKTLASYKSACTQAIQKYIGDCKVLKYYTKHDIKDGNGNPVEYIKEL